MVDMLGAMQQAIEQFQTVEVKDEEAVRAAGKPLAEAVSALDEALDRGKAVIDNARQRVLTESARKLRESLDDMYRAEPWWRRWACRRYLRRIRNVWFLQAEALHRRVFDSLVEGYGLIQSRLERVMQEERIKRIPCVGQTVDPHCMTVVEVLDDPDGPSGVVVDEVRRGYYWRGKVLRFAEVRAIGQK